MSRITTCPHCSTRLRVSEQITDKTLICPHCFADVDNPQPGLQVRTADINTDVKRDVKMGNIVLAVLIGFCVLGVAVAVVRLHSSSDVLVLFVTSAALAGLLIIAIMRGMDRRMRSGDKGSTVAGVLWIMLISMAFSLVTIVCAFLFLLLSCKEEGQPSLQRQMRTEK